MTDIDKMSVHVECDNCRNTIVAAVGWLKEKTPFNCPTCKHLITVDFEDVYQQIDDLDRKFTEVKNRINKIINGE